MTMTNAEVQHARINSRKASRLKLKTMKKKLKLKTEIQSHLNKNIINIYLK